MATIDSLNMISLLKAGLEKEVKNAMTEEMVKKGLEEYEVKLRKTIKPLVEKITFKGIDSIKDNMRLREELHVFLRWDDEES